MGFKRDWKTQYGISQWSNTLIYIRVCEQDDGYHKFEACPIVFFDRWANSAHIEFMVFKPNYNKKTKTGWKRKQSIEDLETKIMRCRWLEDNLPKDMWNSCLKIDLG
jgi:hypothetical protein